MQAFWNGMAVDFAVNHDPSVNKETDEYSRFTSAFLYQGSGGV